MGIFPITVFSEYHVFVEIFLIFYSTSQPPNKAYFQTTIYIETKKLWFDFYSNQSPFKIKPIISFSQKRKCCVFFNRYPCLPNILFPWVHEINKGIHPWTMQEFSGPCVLYYYIRSL